MIKSKSLEMSILVPEPCIDILGFMRKIIEAIRVKNIERHFQKCGNFPMAEGCLLIAALALFTKTDAAELFSDSKDVYEPSMVGCVYRYMYVAMSMGAVQTIFPDVDIEYDRMRIDRDKYGPKTVFVCDEQDVLCDEHQRMACKQLVKLSDKRCEKCHQYEKKIRPDLIIHKRNSELRKGNGLFVEFKRGGVNDIGGDKTKVSCATCPKGLLHYLGGAFVTLSKEIQQVEFYCDSKPSVHVDVSADEIVIK